MKTYKIVELLGDGISGELSQAVHRLAESLPFKLEFAPVDLSVEARDARGEKVYDEIMEAMDDHKVAMKYPTATIHESPNKVLRDRCRFAVIHRPVSTIPGIQTNFTKNLDIDVVRIATGGTYEDRGRRIGYDSAVSLRVIERGPSRHAGRFAFKLASMKGAHVVSTSKYTIQKEADGLFEEAVEEVASDYPGIPYRRELFDALLAGVIMRPERYRVIVLPNEYGDFLSDMACGLIGSIGLGDSASYSFDANGKVRMAMFDPSGGSAPDIAGQGICNPTAAMLAMASMLDHLGENRAAVGLREAIQGAIRDGEKTADIGGKLDTAAFTEVIIKRLSACLATAS